MASPVVLEKLNSVARCLERLESKTPPTLDILIQDVDAQDILVLNLERLVQLCVDIAGVLIAERNLTPIPKTMAESFDVLIGNGIIPDTLGAWMRRAVGFRNIAVHEYRKVNWEIVFRILTEHLEQFKDYARRVEQA